MKKARRAATRKEILRELHDRAVAMDRIWQSFVDAMASLQMVLTASSRTVPVFDRLNIQHTIDGLPGMDAGVETHDRTEGE